MGRRLDLTKVTETECEQILKVIQRDFELRHRDKERLGKIEEELNDEKARESILIRQRDFNDNFCIRCCSRFVIFFNSKLQCRICLFYVCKSCATYDKNKKLYVCSFCNKQLALEKENCDWFYSTVKGRFKHFGSAKVVRTLYKQKAESDAEYESAPETRDRRDSQLSVSRSLNRPVFSRAATVDATRELESSKLQLYLTAIATDAERKLAKSSGDKHILDHQRELLCSSLEDFSRNMWKASEGDESLSAESLEAKQAAVQNALIEEVERFLNREIILDADNNKSIEELLTDEIINAVHADYEMQVEEDARRDEEDLIEGLTKLSNRATLHQLSDFVTMDSELEDAIPEEDAEEVVVLAAVHQHNSNAPPSHHHHSKKHQPTLNGHAPHSSSVDKKKAQPSKAGNAVDGKKSSRQQNESWSSASPISSLEMSSTAESRSLSRASSEERKVPASKGTRGAHTASHDHKEAEDEVPLPVVALAERASVEASSHFAFHAGDETDGVQGKALRQAEQNKAHGVKPASANEARGQGHSVKDGKHSKGKERSRHSSSEGSHSDIEISRAVNSSVDSSPHALHLDMDVAVHDKNGDLLQNVSRSANKRGAIDSSNSRSQTASVKSVDSNVGNQAGNESEWKMLESRRSYVTEEEIWDTVEKTKSYVNRDGLHSNGQLLTDEGVSINGPVFDKLEKSARVSVQRFTEKHESTTKAVSAVHGKNYTDGATETDNLLQMNAGFKRKAGTVQLMPSDEDVEHVEIEEQQRSDVEAPLRRSVAGRKVVLPTLDGSSSGGEEEEEKGTPDYFEVSNRRIPLPDFGSDDRNEVIDLDDIVSAREAAAVEGRHRDVTFKNTYGSLFKNISAYSNSGVTRVGSDEGPLFMHVPRSTGSVHIGNKKIEDISDMSENDAYSSDSDDGYHMRTPWKKRNNKALHMQLSDSGCQTDMVDALMSPVSVVPVSTASASTVTSPVSPQARSSLSDKAVLHEESDSDDSTADPKFDMRPLDVEVAAGDPATFKCRVSGTQPIDVFWYRHGEQLVSLADSERADITPSAGNVYQLDLYNTVHADAGVYVAIAVNACGKRSKRFKVTVKENRSEKKAPELLLSLDNVTVVEGRSVRFRCKIAAYPQPLVTWYKDGRRVLPSDKRRIERPGNRDYELSIDNVTLDDDAEYMFVARNVLGEAKSKAQLFVESKKHEAESRTSAPVQANVTKLTSSDDLNHLYPSTDDLMKVVAAASLELPSPRSSSERGAKLATIHRHLDEMDRKLNVMQLEMEDTVVMSEYDLVMGHLDTGAVAPNTEGHDQKTKQPALTDVSSVSRLLDGVSYFDMPDKQDDEVELSVSYRQFEQLYNAGMITSDQRRRGHVPRRDLHNIQAFLASAAPAPAYEGSHDLTMSDDFAHDVNCGPKQMSTQFYSRDFVIDRPANRSSQLYSHQQQEPYTHTQLQPPHVSVVRVEQEPLVESVNIELQPSTMVYPMLAGGEKEIVKSSVDESDLVDVSVSELKRMWEENDDRKKRELQRQLSLKADNKSSATTPLEQQQQLSKTSSPVLHSAPHNTRKPPTAASTTSVKTDLKGVPTVRVDPLKRTHSSHEKPAASVTGGSSSSANRRSMPVSQSLPASPRVESGEGSTPKVSELKTRFQQQHNIRRRADESSHSLTESSSEESGWLNSINGDSDGKSSDSPVYSLTGRDAPYPTRERMQRERNSTARAGRTSSSDSKSSATESGSGTRPSTATARPVPTKSNGVPSISKNSVAQRSDSKNEPSTRASKGKTI